MKNRIRDLREDRDLRQIDVSAATGIDQKTLSNYETGKTCPDAYAISALADFFGVTTDYLIGRAELNLCDYADVIAELKKVHDHLERLLNALSTKQKQ